MNLTFRVPLLHRSNPGFVELGNRLGKEVLFSYLEKFGFGKKTGIDLNGESKGIIFNLDRVGDLELATTAFGQGVSVTPVQQVTAVSAVVNGGNLYSPYIVDSVVDVDGKIVFSTSPKFVRRVISEETSLKMRSALESVVARGGGRYAYIDGYRVGGKTGTAQKVENGRYLDNNYIMSFMSVVPSNKPEAVLYLAIDNPKNTALLSSYTTAPVARRILLDIIDALDIEKQSGQIEKIYQWDDKVYTEIPNVVGSDVKKAKTMLFEFEIEYTGTGNKVIEQSPEAGERIAKGSTIRLLLGE